MAGVSNVKIMSRTQATNSSNLPASSVLVLQILHCLEEGLDSYARMTESASAGNAQFLAEVGMDLDSLLEGANADLGGLIIAEYVSSLFSAVYGIFFSTTLASVFYQVALPCSMQRKIMRCQTAMVAHFRESGSGPSSYSVCTTSCSPSFSSCASSGFSESARRCRTTAPESR